MLWWDNQRSGPANQVKRLAHEAVALDLKAAKRGEENGKRRSAFEDDEFVRDEKSDGLSRNARIVAQGRMQNFREIQGGFEGDGVVARRQSGESDGSYDAARDVVRFELGGGIRGLGKIENAFEDDGIVGSEGSIGSRSENESRDDLDHDDTLAGEANARNGVVVSSEANEAREKWTRALEISKANDFPPGIKFNLTFALACNLYDAGDLQKAERAFNDALRVFPPGTDIHELPENTRHRVGITLDRLAQLAQNKKRYQEALNLYARALDALMTPQEIGKMDAKWIAAKPAYVESAAGIFNNLATLYKELGRERQGLDALDRSDALLAALKQSRVEL